jgi:hypothetical protein
LLLPHQLRRLTHWWLKLLGFVLTWRSADMKEHFVIDPLISKRQQLLLATQLCRMVLKVCFEFPYCIAVVCYVNPCPSLPSLPVRVTTLAFYPLPPPASRTQMSGKRGSDPQVAHAKVPARYTRQAPFVFVAPRTVGNTWINKQALRCVSIPCTVELALFSDPNSFDRSTM